MILNKDIIAMIYAEARRMSREGGTQFQVDHIVPLNGKAVSGLHVEANLRVLPADVNRSKGNSLIDANA